MLEPHPVVPVHIEPFQRGDLERAFEAAAFRLAVGELSPVIETAAGFHVVLRKS